MPDFIGSLLVFSVVLTVFLFSWNSVEANQNKFGTENQMRQDAYYTTTFLVSTQGYPEDWTNSTVEIPGFTSESDNVISTDKLREFRELSYKKQKKLLGARNFYLVFKDEEDNIIQLDSENIEYGEKPVNASTVVPITRNVLIDRPSNMVDAEMKYVVWR